MPNRLGGEGPSRLMEGIEEGDEWYRFADEELNRQLEEFKLSSHHEPGGSAQR